MWGNLLLLLCLSQYYMLVTSALNVEDWVKSVDRAASHDHWAHIVKRSSFQARYTSNNRADDASHIVNVQDYYRAVFDEGWDDYKDDEQELFNLLGKLERIIEQRNHLSDEVTSQSAHRALEWGVHTKPIRGRYIVMFESGTDDYTLDRTMAVMEKANRDSRMKIRATDLRPLRYAGKGFTVTLNMKAVGLMAKHPSVLHIEEDVALRRSDVLTQADEANTAANGVPWNLDRIDQHSNKLNQEYSPDGDGSNVDIYIIDTGVMASHQEFEGRVRYAGFDAVDHLTGTHNEGTDCNGHGTHCAGTAAGKTYGVAKKANIYNLRALNCEGTGAVSGIVMGIDKIIQHKQERGNGRPIVISQSLGVKKSTSLNRAIKEASNAGIVCVGAAGNQGSYSCNYSPASAMDGISVGAIDKNDEVTMFTNTGECTTIMAPGTQITSASIGCNSCTKTMSGTSMAAPHVAGYAAIALSQNPSMSPAEIKAQMIRQSTKGKILMSVIAATRVHTTPNRLLYVESLSAAKEAGDNVASIQGVNSRP